MRLTREKRDMHQLYDILRRKQVAATPEETVRQWFITVLRDRCLVPLPLMNSEVSFALGSKQFRADVLIWNKAAEPLAVVECKRPEVILDENVLDQAARYNIALNVKWIFLTNGKSTMVLKLDDGAFHHYPKLPTYAEMLSE